MGALLIVLWLLVKQGESITVKEYGKRYGSGGMFFNAIICLFAVLFFVIVDRDGFHFPPALLLYGGVSCILFAAGFYSAYVAFRLGSYANSKMMTSTTTVISIVYGVCFLGEALNAMKLIAIGLFFLAVFLMNYEKGEGQKKAFNFKWFTALCLCLWSPW